MAHASGDTVSHQPVFPMLLYTPTHPRTWSCPSQARMMQGQRGLGPRRRVHQIRSARLARLLKGYGGHGIAVLLPDWTIARHATSVSVLAYIDRLILDTCRRPDQGSILTTARGALSSRRPHPAPTTPASSVHILCNFLIAITHFRRHRGRRGSGRLQTGGISPCEHRGRLQLGEICRGP